MVVQITASRGRPGARTPLTLMGVAPLVSLNCRGEHGHAQLPGPANPDCGRLGPFLTAIGVGSEVSAACRASVRPTSTTR
jgi:hypothetical protein